MLMLLCCVAAWGQDDSVQFTPMGSGYTPAGITTAVEYDAQSGSYVRVTKVGDMVVGRDYMSFDEYQDWQMDQLMESYWNENKDGTVLDNAEG